MSHSVETLPLGEDKGRSRRPIVELLLLAAPTVAQMASYTVMTFVDRFMLSYVGDHEAASAGTSGLTFFCFIGFGFGVMFIVNALTSQSLGRNDGKSVGQYLWQGIWFGLAFGMLTWISYPFAEPLFLAMGHEPAIASLEATYFQVLALGAPIKLISMAMGQSLLGLHRPTVVMFAAFAGVLANVVFNYLLIYGHYGFPRLGIAGAAWGTNAACAVELLVLGVYLARPKMVKMFNTFDWRVRWPMMKTLLVIGVPAGFQLICDITAWTVFMNVIVASFGTAALTANSFAFGYMHLAFMPAFGVGTAVTALVGKYIGSGEPEKGERRAHLGFFVCAAYMMTIGVGLFIFREPLMRLFSDDPEVIRIGSLLLIFIAAYQLFDAMFVIYVSALRGAGDTMVPAIVQAILVWTIVVGGGAISVKYFPEWGVAGPWTLATIFGGILGLYLLLRFQRGKWKSIRLAPDTTGDKVTGLDTVAQTGA